MDAQNYQEMQNNLIEKAEQFKKKACEMEEQVSANINDLMVNTADRLDQAADKMKSTAEFFRNKNVNTLKEDVSVMVKNLLPFKYWAKASATSKLPLPVPADTPINS